MKPAALVRLTLLYLAAPQLLFLATWLQPAVGLLTAAAVVAGLFLAWRATTTGSDDGASLSVRVIAIAGILAVAMTLISGAGGVFHQTWDWEKHNAVLLDLTRFRWPVVYELAGGERYHLMYYLGYYLPAGLAAKLGGAAAGQAMLFAWTALGTSLALLWFTVLVGARPILSLLAFPLLGGMDIVGYALLHGAIPAWFQNIEAWLPGYVDFANLMLHIWSPQHALAVWLGTPLILTCAARPRWLGAGVLGWALLIGWSSLIFAVLALVLAAAVLRSRQLVDLAEGVEKGRARPLGAPDRHADFERDFGGPSRPALPAAGVFVALARSLASWRIGGPVAAGLLLVAIEGLYFTNGISPIPLSWLGAYVDLPGFLPKLILFYLLEFGLFLLLLPRQRTLSSDERFFALLGLGLLLFAPWIHFGLMNDLTARMAHVGQYLVWVVLLAGIWRAAAGGLRLRLAPLGLCLAVGAVAPLWQLQFVLRATALNPHPPRAETAVPQLQPPAVAAQYLGSLHSARWRWLGPQQVTAAPIAALPGEPANVFASPFLLFNFRGQGVERDTSGWWMWNRDTLDLSYLLQQPHLREERMPVSVSFELMAADHARTVTLTLTGASAPPQTFTIAPGEWRTFNAGPFVLSRLELILHFTSAEPPTMPADDPHRREFAVKNVRFQVTRD